VTPLSERRDIRDAPSEKRGRRDSHGVTVTVTRDTVTVTLINTLSLAFVCKYVCT